MAKAQQKEKEMVKAAEPSEPVPHSHQPTQDKFISNSPEDQAEKAEAAKQASGNADRVDVPKGGAKMKFKEDKFVGGKVKYEKDKVYDIPEASVERWAKRGGVIVK